MPERTRHARKMYEAIAEFYTRFAKDFEGDKKEVDALDRVPQAEAVESGCARRSAIVGAGPAGLFLSLLLRREGIDSVVLKARSRAYVESRVRAGVLEPATVELMQELGVDERLRREAMVDDALDILFSGRSSTSTSRRSPAGWCTSTGSRRW